MYHLVHSSASWTNTDPIYSQMSPILKTLGHHSSSNFHSNFTNSSKYTCESCLDHTYAHFFLGCVCGKYTCCSCYYQKAHCLCNLPFNCNSIFTATSHYYELLKHDCKLERNFLKLKFLDIETLQNISEDSRNRSELV